MNGSSIVPCVRPEAARRKMNNTLSVSKAQSCTKNQNFYLIKFCLFLKTK